MVIAIIGVLVSGISAVFIGAQNTQTRTLQLEAATRAAQLQIESFRNNNYNSLVPGEEINFTSSLPSTMPDNKTAVARISEPKPGLKRVDVEISYQAHSKEEKVQLSSLIGILGITQ